MKQTKLLRAAFFLIFLGIMAFAAWKLYGIYSAYAEGTNTYDELAEQYVQITPAAPSPTPEVEPEPESQELSVSFDALLAQCPDVVAWIYSEGTQLNYPIVQSGDNDYYLRRLMNGRYNIGGTIFMDYRNNSDFSDWNTIIYGHNMKNGSMFGDLPKYMDQSYYDAHPVIRILTPEKEFELHLIGGYVTPADSEAYVFPATQEEQNELIDRTCRASTFRTQAVPQEGDKLVTLSTCVYDYENARFVLVGLLREVSTELSEENT